MRSFAALRMTAGARAVTIAIAIAATTVHAQTAPPPPTPQNPSPMVEHARVHERIAPRDLAGTKRTFAGPSGRDVELFVPAATRRADSLGLVVHFLGGAFIPEYAVSQLGGNRVVAAVSLPPGSGSYAAAFAESAVYDSLLVAIDRETSAVLKHPAVFRSITLSGFSAGHAAIRAILRDPAHYARVDAVLLLDGMHTSYVPAGTVLDKGGTLDTTNLVIWERLARDAMAGRKRFLVTHSEIFPGTFASTTETADWLLERLGLRRTPVLKWGPRGMQQLSEVRSGRFVLLGFAGNSAPDHIDQFQGMPELLAMLEGM